jgi:hypothetical protein
VLDQACDVVLVFDNEDMVPGHASARLPFADVAAVTERLNVR